MAHLIECGNTAAELYQDRNLSPSEIEMAERYEAIRNSQVRYNRLNDSDFLISAFSPDAWFYNMAEGEGDAEISRMLRLASKALDGDYASQVVFLHYLMEHAKDYLER